MISEKFVRIAREIINHCRMNYGGNRNWSDKDYEDRDESYNPTLSSKQDIRGEIYYDTEVITIGDIG